VGKKARERKQMIKAFGSIQDKVLEAEDKFIGRGKGKAREDWVVNQLNALIDIPIMGEKMEEKLIRAIVKVVVKGFNKVWRRPN